MNAQQARHNMISQQIRALGVTNETIINTLNNTPREFFVPTQYTSLAFAEIAIPLAHDQFMMLPAEEALMLQILNIQPTDRVLEIGTGSGYITALLAKLSAHVDSIDIFADFITATQDKLTQLNINNVTFYCGDIFKDTRIKNLYDVVVITGSLPTLPPHFRHLLTPTSRMFVVLGVTPAMSACLVTLTDKRNWHITSIFETVLPKLINAPEPALSIL